MEGGADINARKNSITPEIELRKKVYTQRFASFPPGSVDLASVVRVEVLVNWVEFKRSLRRRPSSWAYRGGR